MFIPYKHLIYKEWLKTRWYAAVALLIGLVAAVYTVVSVHSAKQAMGSVFYYSSLILEKPVYCNWYLHVPMLAALLVGLSQFLPEITDKRVKLTFHLPLSPVSSLYCMVLYGFGVVASVTVLPMLLMCALLTFILPWEFIQPALATMWPWCLGGITCYFFIAMIAMEPKWKYRIIDMVWVYFVLQLFFGKYGLGNAVSAYPLLYAVTVIAGLSVVYTANRFNKGGY